MEPGPQRQAVGHAARRLVSYRLPRRAASLRRRLLSNLRYGPHVMSRITAGPVPDQTLLSRYRARRAYTDAYWLDAAVDATLPDYVEAFYTTPLFRLERLVLRFLGRPSLDAEARAMAQGTGSGFAAWTVEARTATEILLCDYLGRTRSWLKCEREAGGTRLYFGSAIVPRRVTADGRAELGWAFHALLGFHRIYSRALLRSAANRLQAD